MTLKTFVEQAATAWLFFNTTCQKRFLSAVLEKSHAESAMGGTHRRIIVVEVISNGSRTDIIFFPPTGVVEVGKAWGR